MAEYKNDYKEEWNGKTGKEVSEIIQTALSSHGTALNNHETSINKSIGDISFKATQNTVEYTVTKNSGDTVTGSFTLTPSSQEYSGRITLSDLDSLSEGNTIVKYGNSKQIGYEYEIFKNNTSKYKGVRGQVSVIIKDQNGVSVVYDKGTTPVTTVGANTKGVLTLNASELPEGTNTITIDITASVGNATVSCENPQTFYLTVLNPVLSVTFPQNNGIDKLRSPEDEFTMNFQVVDSKGKSILINGKAVTITKKIYYNSTQCWKGDGSSTEKLAYNKLCGNSINNGRQLFFVQAEITSGDTTVKSNIVLLYMMCNNNTDSSYVQYAIMLNDVAQITTQNPTIVVKQYNEYKFTVYGYTGQAATLYYQLINGNDITTLTTRTLDAGNVADISYSYIFKSDAEQTFRITNENGCELSINLNVESIESSMGELGSQTISLSALGKSQDSKGVWTYGDYSTTFNSSFDWSGNGWIDDALVVNGGAMATIDYCPFGSNTFTASFKINAQNSIANEKLVYCESGSTGFAIYPEKATFQINGTGISTEFDSLDTKEITFVRYDSSYGNLITIFINGQACVSKPVSSDSLSITAPIVITANETNLYVYNINIFKEALSFTNVQALYCFNQNSSEDIVKYINNNNVFTQGADLTSTENSSQKITIDSLPVGSRYLLIKSYINANDNTSEDPTPWITIDEYPGAEADKYKGIRHLVGNVLFVEKTEDDVNNPSKRNFCADKATLCAQGTSSMAYPIKNFRLCFQKPIDKSCSYYNEAKNSTLWGDDAESGDFGFTTLFYTGVSSKFKIKTCGTTPDGYSTEVVNDNGAKKQSKPKYALFSEKWGDSYTGADAKIWCLKADFAESSGSHNTGFARMVHEAMTKSANICNDIEVNNLLPQQYIENRLGTEAKYTKQIRSTIDGFPIYLFFEDEQGTQKFHGKYNFNNEKSSKDVFGFEKIHDYFDNEIVKNESTLLKKLFNDEENGYYDFTHEHYSIDDNGEYDGDGDTYVNPTECWEFSNNTFTCSPLEQNTIGAFAYPYTVDFNGNALNSMPNLNGKYSNKNPFKDLDSDGTPLWLSQAWEYRYPGLDDGSAGDQCYRNGDCPPFLLNSLYRWLYSHTEWEQIKVSGVTKNILSFNTSKVGSFAEDLHKYFNVNYLIKYFVLTKWFGCVDQRIKNCMISFYCDPTVESNEDADCPMGHMRAYYIFYDNDTILGLDNAGTLTQDWNIDEDVYPGNGQHAIWDMLEYCYKYFAAGNTDNRNIYNLGEMIQTGYQSLRTVITDDVLTKYFETDQVDKFPDAVHNADAEMKYYFTGETNTTEQNFSASVIAKFQGNRRYHRKRWLKLRTNWFDAKFNAGNSDQYSYQFKSGGTSGTPGKGGTIKLTSSIENWRFHITDSTSKLKLSSKLLNSNNGYVASMVIPDGSYSVSDFVILKALYGCTEIDMSGFNTNTWFNDLSNGGNTLPYLKTFILNTEENTSEIKKFSSSAFSELFTLTSNGKQMPLFPNLENLYICNTVLYENDASSRFGELDLSQFSKLKVINAIGTDADILLPNSSSLATLKLQSPQKLAVSNKGNLETIEIKNTDNLTSLTVGARNSSLAYDYLLKLISEKISNTSFVAKVTLGEKSNYYNITNDQVTILMQLATGDYSNLEVSGYIYNDNITSEQMDTLTSKWKDLVVSSSVSSTLEFSLSNTYLPEGDALTITLTSGLLESSNDWYWAIQDGDKWVQKGSPVEQQDATRTKLVLYAKPSESNDTKDYLLKIGAYQAGSLVEYGTISVRYIAITSITISAKDDVLGEGISTELNYECLPTNHTKSEWLKSKAQFIEKNCSCVMNTNGKITITMSSSTEDATVQFKAGDLLSKNTVTILADKFLTKFSNVSTQNSENDKFWIYQLFKKKNNDSAYLDTIDDVTVGKLHAISLTQEWVNSCLSSMVSAGEGQGDVAVAQDLEWLQYCSYTDNSFVIPSNLQFTNITIPYGKSLKLVSWSPDMTYTGFKNVVFPSSVEQVIVSINGTENGSYLGNLILDFSKTSLTKIYSASIGQCDNMAANISITYKDTVGGTKRENVLFKYPPTLQTFGNYAQPDDQSNGNTFDTSTIFNYSDSTQNNSPFGFKSTTKDATKHSPYTIEECSTVKTLGSLFSFKLNDVSEFSCNCTNLQKTYFSFYNGNLPSSGSSFPNITHIGTGTFRNCNQENLSINSDVEYIGATAFSGFSGNIVSEKSKSYENAQVLKVEEIGRYAFSSLSNSHIFEFPNLKKVGEYAFAIKENSNVKHTIYITSSTAFEYDITAFGEKKTNTVYMSKALYETLSKGDNWSELINNVNIETLS